jgi:hypothetical protein
MKDRRQSAASLHRSLLPPDIIFYCITLSSKRIKEIIMRLSVISALLALAACARDRPLGKGYRLSTPTPRAACRVDLPPGVAVPENGVTLRWRPRATIWMRAFRRFRIDPGHRGTSGIFSVWPTPIYQRCGHFRQGSGEWETTAPDETSGSYAISVAACPIGDGPGADAVMTVWITPGNGAPLTPVARRCRRERHRHCADKGICG